MNLKKLFLLCSLVFTTMAFAQQTIKGSVKDSKGKPVTGATVLVIGTSRSATTNSDGGYSIEAQAEETLQFAAQGYQNVQKKVGLETTIDIVLPLATEENKKVGALGVERDANAAGYTDTTLEGGEDLKGKTAGLTATSSGGMQGSKMELRGKGSVTGSNQPLIVIDGVPMVDMGSKYGDSASEINKDDIESVTVLTGGAATALYGSRGGNGVILYTTKSGKGGKTAIDINSSVSFDRAYISPKLQNEYGGGSSLDFTQQLINGTTYNLPQYEVDESWGPKYDGTPYLPWYAFDKKYLPEHYLKPVPWQAPKNDIDKFFRTGMNINNSASITRSISGTNLRFSLGNTETTGIVPTTELRRTSLAFSFTSELSKKLKAEGGLNYSITVRENPNYTYADANDNGGFSTVLYGYTHRQLDMENLRRFYKSPIGEQRTWNRTSWENPKPNFADNLYWMLYENTSNDKRHRFFGNIGLTYNFTDKLFLVGKIYGDIYALTTESRTAVGSHDTSQYSRYIYDNSSFNYETRLHYNPDLGENFTLTGFIGVARAQNKYEYVGAETQGGLIVPNYYSAANSKERPRGATYSSWTRTNSVYGMASFGYKGTAFVEVTGRNDWFSTVSTSIFYPSVTASYVFSNSFKNLPSWFTYGKLRAGWAQVGNDASAYVLKTYPSVYQPFKGAQYYLVPTEKKNPELRPEIKETKEAGIDLQFFNGRLSLGFSYYDILSKDLILSMPVDAANGYTYKKVNSGEMVNRGFEITLSATPVQTDKFSWTLDWNLSRNRNKLLKLAPGLSRYKVTWDYYDNVHLYAVEGRPFGEIYGGNYVYDDKGNRLVDEEGNYFISPKKEVLGNINPDFTTGLTNTLTYGNLSLSFTFDYSHGGSYYAGPYALGMYAGTIRETIANGMRERDPNGPNGQKGLVLDGVVGHKQADGSIVSTGVKNTKAISPKEHGTTFYKGIDAQAVFDATFLKLRSVSLSYDVPLTETRYIKGLNFTLSGYNLWTGALAWDGMDPETAMYNQGMGNSSLPTIRSYALSVGLKL